MAGGVGPANFDLDRSKLQIVSFTFDSPRLENQDEDKTVLCRHQKVSCGEKGDFTAWCVGRVQTLKAAAQRKRCEEQKGDQRTPSIDPCINVRAMQLARSWKSFSSLEGTRWKKTCSPSLSSAPTCTAKCLFCTKSVKLGLACQPSTSSAHDVGLQNQALHHQS